MNESTFDIVLRNGTVIDGTGTPSRPGDVAVSRGRIAAVGRVTGRGKVEVDCRGLFIAPGFIDIHSHSDFTIFREPRAVNYVAQGVTLIVSGNCGTSGAPLDPEDPETAALLTTHDLREVVTWSTFVEYMEALDRLPKAVNVATLVGFGNVRAVVMGYGASRPSRADLEAMKGHVREAMEAGAFGLSTGLIYVPQVFAGFEEVLEVAKAAGDYGGLYATHLRNESERLIDAVIEAVRVGQASGLRVQISHHKVAGRRNWGLVRTALELEEYYRRLGVEVTCDVYPYTAGATGLSALFPSWTQRRGREGFLRLLQDPEARERIKADLSRPSPDWENLLYNGGFEGVVFSHSKVFPEYLGLSLAEVARRRAKDPLEVVLELVAEDFDAGVIIHSMSDDDMRYVLRHRLSMVADDGSVVRPGEGCPHPRAYGAFTRVLATYARDEGLLTLEEAVHKMTGLPAWKLGLEDRGLVRAGVKADLAVFDLWRLGSASEFGDPHHLAEGMVHVLVNGDFVVRDGRPTGEMPGEVVRRPGTWNGGCRDGL